MEHKEYQKQSKRTCPSLGSLKLDSAHMVLGMNSEIVEMQEALKMKDLVNLSEELADFSWYTANYCTFRELDYSFIASYMTGTKTGLNSNGLVNALYKEVSLFQDQVKKFIAYNKPMEDEQASLGIICWYIRDLANRKGVDLQEAFNKNIAKLKERYPEGFTENQAINRNIENERKILES